MPIRLIFSSSLFLITVPLLWLVRTRAETLRLAYVREAQRAESDAREEDARQMRLAEQAERARFLASGDAGVP